MAKDGLTIFFGIIYCTFVGFCWQFLFSSVREGVFPFYTYKFYLYYLGGMFSFIGNLILIPSTILYLIFFCSTEGHTSASVGFGLGIPGWILGAIGTFITYINYTTSSYYYYPAGVSQPIISYIAVIVFGSLLFARRHKWEEALMPMTQETVRPMTQETVRPMTQETVRPMTQETVRPTSEGAGLPGPPCSVCSRATRYIAQYGRYYCDTCKKYT